jgi:hypothetical protein
MGNEDCGEIFEVLGAEEEVRLEECSRWRKGLGWVAGMNMKRTCIGVSKRYILLSF